MELFLFEKNQFRNKLISNIHLMSETEKNQKSNLIFLNLKKFMGSSLSTDKSAGFGSGLWGCFQPLASEPQIEFKQISESQWCYPKTESKKLSFYSDCKNFSTSNSTSSSSLNVLEPTDGVLVDQNQMTGVCVPGLGFHTEGYRLGRGKGFYDQTFSQFLGLKIGLCFDFCISKEIPFEAHDLKMDYIITDIQVLHTGEK